MSVVVVGSIAFDSVRTPFGERERMLGGSAVHFALAASFFTEVRVVGPVGDDLGGSAGGGPALPREHPARPAARRPRPVDLRVRGARLDEPLDRHGPGLAR